MRARSLVMLIACACACAPAPRPDPPAPTPVGPGTDCEAACGNLVRLRCTAAQGSAGPDDVYGTTDDVGCVQACLDVEAAGIQLDTPCVAAATSCGAADDCAR